MGEGNKEEKLNYVINSCIGLAIQQAFKSISIPAISSGIFGLPKDRWTKILVNETMKYISQREKSNFNILTFCLLDSETIN